MQYCGHSIRGRNALISAILSDKCFLLCSEFRSLVFLLLQGLAEKRDHPVQLSVQWWCLPLFPEEFCDLVREMQLQEGKRKSIGKKWDYLANPTTACNFSKTGTACLVRDFYLQKHDGDRAASASAWGLCSEYLGCSLLIGLKNFWPVQPLPLSRVPLHCSSCTKMWWMGIDFAAFFCSLCCIDTS